MTGENDAISQFPEKCQTSTNFWAKFTRGMLKTKKVSSVKKEGIDKPKSGTASDVGGVISLTIVRKKQTDRRIVVSETGKQPDNWLSKSKSKYRSGIHFFCLCMHVNRKMTSLLVNVPTFVRLPENRWCFMTSHSVINTIMKWTNTMYIEHGDSQDFNDYAIFKNRFRFKTTSRKLSSK